MPDLPDPDPPPQTWLDQLIALIELIILVGLIWFAFASGDYACRH
jgi:hypothetical protein